MLFPPIAGHSGPTKRAFGRYLQAPSEETKAEIERARTLHRKRVLIYETVSGVMLIGTIYAFHRLGSSLRTPPAP